MGSAGGDAGEVQPLAEVSANAAYGRPEKRPKVRIRPNPEPSPHPRLLHAKAQTQTLAKASREPRISILHLQQPPNLGGCAQEQGS